MLINQELTLISKKEDGRFNVAAQKLEESAELLIKSGADVNQQKGWRTALMIAAYNNRKVESY
ncbi:MAG: ankyrin repeat domain-containing protein [Rickettsia sp.]|nr:ankyrin repeat domain-containing protein [Rickettsia sp.]